MIKLKTAALLPIILVGGLVLAACSPANDSSTAPESAPAAMDSKQAMDGESQDGDAMMDKDAMLMDKNIVETAAEAGQFSTLLTAAEAAGLADTLATTEDITVFAPTDAAFDALPAGTLEDLLANPDQLAEILQYHVVSGVITADQVAGLSSATTLQGSAVSVETANGEVMINDATVIQPDVMASNGVIHVIDTVLLPE